MSVAAAKASATSEARKPRRARTPSVLQMEAVECGAASLAMILGHHGRWVPLEDLRLACGVTRDGSNAANVLKAARRYGLGARGFRKEPGQLLDLPVPSIIHWNFNHYVVFEGMRGDRVYLNDPASGPRVVSREELDASFTGVVLAFEPGEGFVRGGHRPSTLGALASYLSGSRLALSFIALASLLLVIPGILIAAFGRIFVDEILVANMQHWLVPLCIGLGLTALLRAILTHYQQKYLLRLEAKLAVVTASRYLSKLLELPAAFFAQRAVGELSNRVAAADRISTLLSRELSTTVFSAVAAIFYAAVLAGYDPTLAAAVVFLTAINFVVLRAVERKRDLLSRRALTEGGRLLSTTVGSITAIETLKSSGTEDDAFARWSGHQANLLTTTQALGVQGAMLGTVPTLLAALTTVAVLGLGGWQVIEGNLTLGALVAVQSLTSSITSPVQKLVDFGGRIQTIKADLARVADTFAYVEGGPGLDGPGLDGHGPQDSGAAAAATEAGPQPTAGEDPSPQGLQIRNLSFGYSPVAPPLIKDFELSVEPGKRVALVGGSGSGKSTVGRLIVGLYRPWTGTVRYNGNDLTAMPPEVFSSTIAHVDQDVFMFEGTVRDNLTLWDSGADDATLTRALEDAELYPEIAARPGRLDAEVVEGGLNFSGGQRQRLEIARALVTGPAVLVLDEATAALDPISEKAIDDNLRRRGSTCIIIAHRLSTIRDCDEILVMRKGKVVERGTHDALLAMDGEYAALIGAA